MTWFALGLTVLSGQAGSDPGDLYLDGFQSWKAGEKLEQEGNKQAALQKYLEAHKSIQTVAQNYPDWQPDVVSYRLKGVEQALSRIGYTVPMAGAPMIPAVPQPSGVLPAPPVTGAPTTVPPQPQGGVSSITGMIDQQFQSLNQQNQALQQQNQDMAEKLKLFQEGYTSALKERQKAEADRDVLVSQMQALNGRLEKLSKESDAKNAAAQAEIQKLRNESKMVSDMLATRAKEFEDSGKVIESLKKEKEALIANQRHLETELAKAKSAPGVNVPPDMAKLLAENARLKGELADAQKQIETLRVEGGKKDQEIAALKTQLTGIQNELASLRKENTDYQSKVAELQLKLKEMNSELQNPALKKPNAQLAKENETLRAIIMRHLRQQQRLLTSKEIVIAEMKKLQLTSETLMENLEDMTSGKVRITVDEESLFTDEELKVIIASKGGGVNATLEAPSSKAKSPPTKPGPAVPPPSTASSKAKSRASISDEEKLMVQADQALQSQDFGKAEKALQDVLRANPKNTSALIGLAGIKRTEKKLAEADVLLQKCLVYEPDNATALYWLGVCQFQQNRLPDALASFEKCAKNDAKNAKAHHYLGIISNSMSNRRRAEAEFKSTLAIDPEYADAYFNLAVLYATSSPPDYDKARENYRNALRRGVSPDPTLEKLLDLKVETKPTKEATAAR